ncbi:unnamed protein product [Leptosia nina]|uniref:Uncharacterized protein n=1 Tax=Leptosia nina TaxID=320188 RepID=A0AAV1JEU3_9NEOP
MDAASAAVRARAFSETVSEKAHIQFHLSTVFITVNYFAAEVKVRRRRCKSSLASETRLARRRNAYATREERALGPARPIARDLRRPMCPRFQERPTLTLRRNNTRYCH